MRHLHCCVDIRLADTWQLCQGTDLNRYWRRPLSKTVRFNVLRVIPAGAAGKKGFNSF